MNNHPKFRTPRRLFTIALFIALSALAVATLMVSRNPISVEVSGSLGNAPEFVFGRLSFVRLSGIIRRIPVDAVWLSLVPASTITLIYFQVPLTLGRIFTVTAVPVGLFVLFYSIGYIDFHTVIFNDSVGYLHRVLYGTYSSFRNVGYPTILLAAHDSIGLDRLAWFQLGTCIACYHAGALLLAVRLGSKWIGSMLALATPFLGVAVQSAPNVLTEPLFMAGFGLFSASLGVLAWRPDKGALAAATMGIILVTLTKTHGVVLVLPALLLVRFLPKGSRLLVSGTIVGCGIATYALMTISSYTRTGIPTPESAAGFSLIGHVGWMLDDASMPPSDLARRMISAAAPVVLQGPPDLADIHSFATLDRYVDVTAEQCNTILWEKLFPIASSELSIPEANSFFLQLGLSSIRSHPTFYLRHVAAHFYGMWRDLGRTVPLRQATIYFRRVLSSEQLALRRLFPASVLTPYPTEEIAKAEEISQSTLPLMLESVWSADLASERCSIALGALALLLSILAFLPGRLPFIYRTEIMIALSLNAYFGVHVLLQVAIERYASAAAFAAAFLAASFVFTTFYGLGTNFANRQHE